MKLYICDEEKISKYNLPEEVQESFIIHYLPSGVKKEYDISVESKDNNWTIRSNGKINFLQNSCVNETIFLNNYSSYDIQISSDNKNRRLFCLPGYNENYTDYSTFNMQNLVIGSGYNSNLVYQNQIFIRQH